jgi:hypothetical protein
MSVYVDFFVDPIQTGSSTYVVQNWQTTGPFPDSKAIGTWN